MTRLHDLSTQQGQSPWLDNLRRDWIEDGTLQDWIERGVRGVTSNPTIFQKAMTAGDAYDEQLRALVRSGASIDGAYWAMVERDISDALRLLRPVFDESGGTDGFVSLELAPDRARDTEGSVDDALRFHRQIDEPNLMIKIPGTVEGIPAVQAVLGAGRNVNITLLFSIERYTSVMEAYLAGLESFAAAGGDLSTVHSVASFFLSRVDTEVDRRLEVIGTEEALRLRGRAAVAQAQLAYRRFRDVFNGSRWRALAAKGATLQRPLWASTSTKNPAYDDLLYVNTLIGPDTVNTMPEATLDAFDDHGLVARTVDADGDVAQRTLDAISDAGVDLDGVSRQLEEEGVAAFAKSFDELMATLEGKAADLARD
jgi:transaldolase